MSSLKNLHLLNDIIAINTLCSCKKILQIRITIEVVRVERLMTFSIFVVKTEFMNMLIILMN